jgi:hypothetical protein
MSPKESTNQLEVKGNLKQKKHIRKKNRNYLNFYIMESINNSE